MLYNWDSYNYYVVLIDNGLIMYYIELKGGDMFWNKDKPSKRDESDALREEMKKHKIINDYIMSRFTIADKKYRDSLDIPNSDLKEGELEHLFMDRYYIQQEGLDNLSKWQDVLLKI